MFCYLLWGVMVPCLIATEDQEVEDGKDVDDAEDELDAEEERSTTQVFQRPSVKNSQSHAISKTININVT